MAKNTPAEMLDVTCDPEDKIEIEVQDRPQGKVLYVHLNGCTILRVCRIERNISFMHNGRLT